MISLEIQLVQIFLIFNELISLNEAIKWEFICWGRCDNVDAQVKSLTLKTITNDVTQIFKCELQKVASCFTQRLAANQFLTRSLNI